MIDAIYDYRFGVGQIYFDAEGGFEIQHQALEALGYPEIKTVKDYENAIKSYIEKTQQRRMDKKDSACRLTAGNGKF